MISCLRAPLADGAVRLALLTEAMREPLRAACALDREIWPISARSFADPHFDGNFDGMMTGADRVSFAVLLEDALVGMSCFLDISAQHRTLEIGTTYLVPARRGTGLNGRMKRLMLDRAFACGIERVEFKIDVRNARSQAAVAKLGAVREGVRRRHMVTWTGHVRDSAIFSILRDEWRPRDERPA